jgi:hypothetical protein
MANALNTLNLLQVKGGVNLKQGDVKSVLEYELGYTDDSDFMTDPKLDGKVAKVTLYNRHTNKKWTTETVVKGNRVSFTIDVPLEIGVYALDIDVEGHIFPSDRDAYVRVHEGYGSYMDGKAAIALVASAKNVADEAIRLAVLENSEKIRGPQGKPGESIRVASVTKTGTTSKVTFTDGKILTVEDGKGIFVDSYRVLSDGNTEIKFTDGKTAVIKKGYDSKVVSSTYDSEGNTIITFNNGSPKVTVNRGEPGKKGDTGNPVNVASVIKSGTTNTVKFTDGKSMKVEDGKSVNVSSTRILDDGNTEITFTDGKKAIVKKGVDGTVKFDDLTEEQKKSLQVDVVDDLTSGGSDKALSAEQGKKLFDTIVKYHPDAVPPKVMTAVIDQANSNPLTCITYEDDAKMMEKGSPEWDDFFQSKLVLFKDGKEVRELEDSELNDLKPEDGDVMVRFPRKGLRIKTVGEKVYVSMTNKADDPDFKYYAHSRGDSPRDAFYLGAYLGFEVNGKLRSITGKAPTGNKTIGDFRTIAQANGTGYEQLAFYQWTFLQAMCVLKYGNLDSQTALGKGNTLGSDTAATGETNGKGIDFGTTNTNTKMRFQWVEDFYGTKSQWCDGFKIESGKMWTGTDKYSNDNTNYQAYEVFNAPGYYPENVIGNTEQGFVIKKTGGSLSTYYSDYQYVILSENCFAVVGGRGGPDGADAGAFHFYASYSMSFYNSNVGARLMFL